MTKEEAGVIRVFYLEHITLMSHAMRWSTQSNNRKERKMTKIEQLLRTNGKVTGEQLKEQFKENPKEVSVLFSFKMKNFYPHATPELVEKEVNAQLAGAKPCNLNYGLWIKTYLRDGID